MDSNSVTIHGDRALAEEALQTLARYVVTRSEARSEPSKTDVLTTLKLFSELNTQYPNLAPANLRGAFLEQLNLSGLNLRKVDLTHSALAGVRLHGTLLRDALLSCKGAKDAEWDARTELTAQQIGHLTAHGAQSAEEKAARQEASREALESRRVKREIESAIAVEKADAQSADADELQEADATQRVKD
jgi:hypothetical protein